MEHNHHHTNTEYLLHLADNALVLGHRNSEWCGHGPILEQDIAITNISLDLIGQARNFYQYAAELTGGSCTEDSLAYLRDAGEFRNAVMAELPKGDWAFTTLRQFLSSAFQHLLYTNLAVGQDARLAGIALKSLKEVTYHLRWSSEWVIRLGDGTEESNTRINFALLQLWPYHTEFFTAAAYETGTSNPVSLYGPWLHKVNSVFLEAGLAVPSTVVNRFSGKTGQHTDDLVNLLAEMQVLPRTYPDALW
ncbi:MAG: phenylacetate-CoA oxygenase subunit PaaI [Chitinophagaceae bacterium]|nr:MAG: phenylacetate-CoA oxygenase subunit PaaI [Chitinophagaceae bacterium]